MAASEASELISDVEYEILEQTLQDSDRGRRFLSEFVRRNRSSETTQILEAVQRMEKSMTRSRKVPDLDQIRLDIADMHDAIERTKLEIANIKQEEADSNRFVNASHELDAIVTQTEGATQNILEAAEKIQESAWTLREAGADDAVCDEIDAKSTEIFMACSFQDLTGQRTNKVVQVLRYLESRINTMINIWGIEEMDADETAGPVDTRPDAHLLNGPQMEGKGVQQDDVDSLMTVTDVSPAETVSPDFDFDAIEVDDDDDEQSVPETVDADFDFDAIDVGEPDTPAETVDADFDFDAIDVGDDADASAEMSADDVDNLFAADAAQEQTDSAAEEAAFDAIDPEVLQEDMSFDAAESSPLSDEAGDAVDEEAVAELFSIEETLAENEAKADAAWEEIANSVEINTDEDPLEELSEAERQALFN